MPDPKLLPDFVYGSTTYVVEKLVETDDILKERLEAPTLDFGARYILRGPLGAEYCLVPNQPNPTLFFAVNAKSFLKANPDISGKIEAAIRQNAGLIAEQILAGESSGEDDDEAAEG